ncbi:LysR family transcriptional regulator [Virgisporangium aliadipatigenens]|uniref:LysR family transcriptional regulator n=1 Tax=Virgisporangium aliadipatigenens TaxID=741659 RepID=A0A8J3YTU0_9ACTN|nr:LysR substrate-binding domain-containing protein [Virgisporangium aliadipatigenens]GIJ51769.1 LysR family transcriptional regulator [Virgisporangium aliadipatigenens]
MERQELEAFLVLARELHFGRTAAHLGLTTARVSQLVRALERRVGVPLFVRTSRRVALTSTGRRLEEDLRPAYQQIRAGLARAVADGRGLTGELRVGFVGAAAGQLAMRAGEAFRRRYRDCAVRLREVHIGGAAERLADESDDGIDLLLGCFPIEGPGLTAGPVLLSERRMLAVSVRHPWARRGAVSVAELTGQPMVDAPCSVGPTANGPRAETFQEVLTLVGAGRGAFVVGAHAAEFHARPDVIYVPLRDAPPLEWGPVWRTTRATARVRAFIDAGTFSARETTE